MSGELNDMIAKVRGLKGLVEKAAPECGDALQASIRSDLAAGRSPAGTPWQALKGGGKPLPNAPQALTVRAIGTTLLASIGFPYNFHNRGTAKVPIRMLLPDSLPPKHAKAIADVLRKHWQRITQGA